jgi:potassium efflux system protein
VRSTSPLWQTPYAGFVESVVVLVDPRSWIPVLRTAWDDVRARTELYVLAALGLLALLVTQRVARRRLVVLGERAARASQLSIAPTLVATALTLLAALPWPMLLVFVGSRLDAPDAPTFARSVAQGLLHAAPTLYILHVLRLVVRRQGVGESHFRFREASVKLLRRNVWWLTVVAVPAEAVVHALSPLDGVTWGEPLARLAFLVQMGAVATFLHRVLHPRHGVLRPDPRSRRAVLPRLRGLWFACGVLGPAALGVLALLGYFFTARHLSLQLELSSGYVLLLVIVQGIALRWVLLTRRRLAIEQLREKRAADHEKDPDSDPVAERAAALEALDVAALSHEVHQLTRMLIGIAAVVGLWFVWVDFVPALGIFREIPLWDSAQRVTRAITDATGAETEETVDQVVVTSLADLLLCLLILFGVVVANKNLPALLEISLLQRLPLLQGERYAITTLTRYAITIVGIVMAFERIGIGWSKVQWLAAGISVGLGFGLQEIFANFVSGLTLLFERPIRVGDWVTVGGIEGHVTRIRMRATTIVDRDLKELIVPNREFVTAQFINWTLSDPVTRVVVPVGVAYGSDVELTETTLHEVGRECPYSVKDPSPNVVFLGFGPSSLDFELRVFVTGRDILPRVTHDLHKRIDAAFRRAKIEIAFPQRDLHLRSAEPLVEALRARSAAKD